MPEKKKRGEQHRKKGSQHKQQEHGPAHTGVVDITRSGMAFIVVDGLEKDIMVRPQNLSNALNGDEVRVKVIKEGKGRTEGEITEVIRRKKTEFTGTLQLNPNFAFLLPDEESLPDIYIPLRSLNEGKDGDKAVVRIVSWGEKTRKPVGEVIELLDRTDTNDTAMKEILVENGFPLSFPEGVLAESMQIPDEIAAGEIAKRKDCRDIFTITIDPADAKDFDDAISFRELKNGNYEIGVHIADVSHYVVPKTNLDEEAYKRATSVYLTDRVLPMLPERISNELCSLRPHEDKLCFSAIFQVSSKAEIKQHWIGRTVIHSNHRFSYEEVQEIIEKGGGLHAKEILVLNNISQQLRSTRFKHGAINFSSREIRFELDENAVPIGIIVKESKEAHQLIEELMLLANKTVAEYVSKLKVNKQPVPFPYRVHDVPDKDKLTIFIAFAAKFGYRFDVSSPATISHSFNEMLEKVQGLPEQHVLEQLGIRTMSKAVYTTENIGHYGLGFDCYCHFTSPIRRYPDVMVHRILAQCIANDIETDKQLEKKCRHCSDMERKAMEAERAANKYKQVEYMRQFVGEEFDGVISGVAHFGFWVETVDTKCEGMVSITSLQDIDDFAYSETDYSLTGMRTHRKFRMGDTVRIREVAANLEKRQLDYVLAEAK